MPICTNTEVFDFMQTGAEARTTAAKAMLTSLISRVEYGMEKYIGRKLEKTSFDIYVHDGRYCSVQNNLMFLTDIYYDIVSITAITEGSSSLTEDTDFVVETPNILERIDSWWDASEQLNIRIQGDCGLVYDSDGQGTYLALPDLKQIAIEEVAAKSGMWNKLVDDGQGNEFVVNKTALSKQTQDRLKRYILPII